MKWTWETVQAGHLFCGHKSKQKQKNIIAEYCVPINVFFLHSKMKIYKYEFRNSADLNESPDLFFRFLNRSNWLRGGINLKIHTPPTLIWGQNGSCPCWRWSLTCTWAQRQSSRNNPMLTSNHFGSDLWHKPSMLPEHTEENPFLQNSRCWHVWGCGDRRIVPCPELLL